MSLFGQGYDPRGQARDADYGNPLPRGKYLLEVSKAEERPTKDGSGAYLYVEHTVTGSQYKGRKVFHRFNLRNRSQQAEEIGRKQFNSFLDAIGMGDVIIKSPTQLLGKAFLGRVDIESRDGREDNVLKGWEDKSAAGAAPQPAAAPAAPAWQRSSPAASPSPAHHNGGAAAQPGPTDAGTGTAHAAAADTTTQPTTAPSDAPARPKKPWEK